MNIFISSYFRSSKELLRDKYSYSCTKSGIARNKLTSRNIGFLILRIMMIKLRKAALSAFLPLPSSPIILFLFIFLNAKFSSLVFLKNLMKKQFGGYKAIAGPKEWILRAHLYLSPFTTATKVKL